MPSVGRFPCESCEYVATNRRMLSRHVVVAHSDKVYKCPVCPFITRYAANWYRHKRHLHGLGKATTCEVCGFFTNSVEELAKHTEVEHPEHLQLRHLQEEHDLEKEQFHYEPAIDVDLSYLDGTKQDLRPANGESEFHENIVTPEDSVHFSLPMNGGFLDSEYNFPEENAAKPSSSTPIKMNVISQDYGNLSPPKIRRSYCCNLCGLLTSNPREFLYHQRDVHNMRMNVFECKLCIYASKHVQKLQRHYGLVHRQKMPPGEKPTPASPRTSKVKKTARKSSFVLSENATVNAAFPNTTDSASASAYEFPGDEPEVVIPLKPVRNSSNPNMLKCETCNYQTRNKFLLAHHEKTVHLKKKFYKCLQCGYVTNEKARYTKHIKYHSLPKMQCEFCHFKSAYKWNMDRHMKNHTMGREGEYNCTLCTFITHSKQSLKMHVANHHHPEESVIDEKEDESLLDTTSDSNDVGWPSTFMNEAAPSYDFNPNHQNALSNMDEKSNMVWNDEDDSPKLLGCNSCDFQTKWSFELRKHEETHKSPKRHSCPLCGMRFEHIAWLTKHLNRIHKGDAQAKNLAAAFELLKPKRRRPAKRPVNNTLSSSGGSNSARQIYPKSDNPHTENQSVLSSLLRSTGPSKYVSILPKMDLSNKFAAAATNGPVIPPPNDESFENEIPVQNKKASPRKTPSCKVCGYQTKWISEMEKHMRVHCEEKPFQCSKCSYHSKWKGDLTRHMMKHHSMKLPAGNKKIPVPKIKLRKTLPSKAPSSNRWQTVKQDTATMQSGSSEGKDQESPLDLTVGRTNIFQPSYSSFARPTDINENGLLDLSGDCSISNEYILGSDDSDNEIMSMEAPFSEPVSENDEKLDTEHSAVTGKRKYHCPFCSFATSTPSRFHVHIVQHYNKKPFMCSLCGYRSNWEWDITKHIRLRGCKDKQHNSACVLLTDETGRRNYEKYDKYLREEKVKAKVPKVAKPRGSPRTRRHSIASDGPPMVKDHSKDASPAEEAPVNIVVTPDITFADDTVELLDDAPFDPTQNNIDDNPEAISNGFKFYMCKHCNYKHSSRKVVISHLSLHAGIRPFRCRVCGLTADWRHLIVRHVKVAHNGYMNDVEDRITYTQEGFVIRITSVRGGSKISDISSTTRKAEFNCKFCPYKCDKEVYIKFHMKQHKPREGAIYQCSFCPYYVKFKKTLVRHLKLHEPPGTNASSDFPEQINGDLLPENANFQLPAAPDMNPSAMGPVYLEEDSQIGQYDEDSIAVSYDQLNAEDTTTICEPVAKFKRHVCEHCPYRTDNRTQYLYHKQFHRPNNSAPFKCNLCTYWATMQHLLTQHMKVHNEQEFQFNDFSGYMDNNNMSFPDVFQEPLPPPPPPKEDLGEIPMILVQRGGISTKMFKCRFCPMMNKKRANVRVHERMHGATQTVGKYTCSLCNYKCLGQGSLTNHMKIHQAQEFQVNTVQDEQKSSLDLDTDSSQKKLFSHFCMRCPAVFKSSSDLYIHRTFHGSNLPFPCPHCDYRAKHKPHLQKHLQVHTLAYVSKRDASCGPPVNSDYDNATDFLDSTTNPPFPSKRIDQMLLLEAAEVKTFLKRGKEYAEKKMHKCPLCPAYFNRTSVLAYHCTLHGSTSEFSCNHCDYSTVRSANFSIHCLVHGKPEVSPRRQLRVLQCPKCPASFNKTDRYERHFNLHGKNSRYVCDQCDYSVRFAANLSKHKLVHLNIQKEAEIIDNDQLELVTPAKAATPEKVSEDSFKSPDTGDDKKTYTCDRCPYFQGRKDAVQSHQQRHNQKEGYQCPHCDYRSMGSSFLRDHVKTHVQPTNLFLPQAFMKYNKFKIWVVDGDSKELLFEDKGPKFDICNRFYPPVRNREDLITQDDSDDEIEEISIMDSNASEAAENPTSDFAVPAPVEKINPVKEVEPEFQPQLLPKVILKDIFSEGKVKKLENGSVLVDSQLKDTSKTSKASAEVALPAAASKASTKSLKKQNSQESSLEKSPTKSSIIVKIKVENIVEDNNERSLYTISSKKSNKTDASSDAASDITIPADDIDILSPESDTLCDDNDLPCPETAEDILSTAGVNADFANMAFKEAEAFTDTNFDSSSSSSLKNNGFMDKDAEFQQTGTDFLKQLDFMVNSVSMNNPLPISDKTQADLQSTLML